MPFIEHTDTEFCDLYSLFHQVDAQLEAEGDPKGLSSLVVHAFNEFHLGGLHRPAPSMAITYEPSTPIPDPVIHLNAAVKTQLGAARDLDESLRLTRARTFLLEAVEYL